MKVQPSIKRVQNQESQEGPPTCDQNHPNTRKGEGLTDTGKDEEPQRAAETTFAAHKLLRHLTPGAHPL